MNINCDNIVTNEFAEKNECRQWQKHPVFAGVSLLQLIAKEEVNNVFKSFMVKVENGCELEEHIHENDWEMHEVIAGNGVAVIAGVEQEYKIGSIAVIPEGLQHSVRAGSEGLVLLAKFF